MHWFKIYIALVSILMLAMVVACSTGLHRYTPPSDHTDSIKGALHLKGAKNANTCMSCHGSDLKGGSAPSCYECHKKKWK